MVIVINIKNDFYDNKIIDEINVDKYLGSYNNIYTDLSFIKPNYFYCITKLDDVTLNYIKGDFKTLQMLEKWIYKYYKWY